MFSFNTYRKYKLIAFVILGVLGLIFPFDYVDPRSTATLPEDFVKELGQTEFEKFGTVYTPFFPPEGYYLESVELITEIKSDGEEAYTVSSIFLNSEGQALRYIQSKNDEYIQDFTQEYVVESDTMKTGHFYVKEGNPDNMVFWKKEEGLYVVYVPEMDANALRNFAREIAGNPIENEENI